MSRRVIVTKNLSDDETERVINELQAAIKKLQAKLQAKSAKAKSAKAKSAKAKSAKAKSAKAKSAKAKKA